MAKKSSKKKLPSLAVPPKSENERKIKRHQASSFDQDLERFEKIFQKMNQHQVAEFEWEKSGERLKVSLGSVIRAERNAGPLEMHSSVHSATTSSNSVSTSSSASPTSLVNISNRKPVLSPFVGTFYRAASPGAEMYAKEGQIIKRGDVLCIIEAMKLMNEIEAEFSGKIVSALVENGQPVEFGEPLFLVEPN